MREKMRTFFITTWYRWGFGLIINVGDYWSIDVYIGPFVFGVDYK